MSSIVYNYIALGMTILFTTAGQLLLKKGSFQVHFSKNIIQTGLSLLNRYVIAGLLCALLAPFFYFFALTEIPLSIAFAFNGFNYILVFIGGRYFFSERINYIHVIGITLIFFGIVIFNL